MSKIEKDDYFVLQCVNGKKSVRKAACFGTIRIYKVRVPLSTFIGVAYGTHFLVTPAGAIKTTPKLLSHPKMNGLKTISATDDNTKIAKVFSDEKKAKKLMPKLFSVQRPTAFNIVSAVDRNTVQYLREDSLSKLLSCANLDYRTSCLVFDNTGGFVTGAVAQRTSAVVVSVSGGCVRQKVEDEVQIKVEENLNGDERTKDGPELDSDKLKDNLQTNEKQIKTKNKTNKKDKNKNFRVFNMEERKNIFFVHDGDWTQELEKRNEKFDSLIETFSASCDSLEITKALFGFLKNGGYFVFYSQYLEQLTKILTYLTLNNQCTNLRLTSALIFKYQVQEHRTRPTNNTEGSGGFVLSGVKVSE